MLRRCLCFWAASGWVLLSMFLAAPVALGQAVVTTDGAPDAAADAAREPAPEDDAPPAEYESLVDAAVAEYSAQHYTEARALFRRAHESFPNARTLRGIGISSYELADYPEAVRTLAAALETTRRALSDEQRVQVTALLERARLLVGTYHVPPSEPTARLFLDDARVDPGNGWPTSAGAVMLGVGEHVFSLRHPDGREDELRLVVRGREDETLELRLPPVVATLPPPIATPDAEEPAPWIVAGIGAGVTIAGVVLFAVGWTDYQSVDGATFGTSWQTLEGSYDRAPVLTGLGIAAMGVGAVTGLVGVIWGVFVEARRGARSASHALRWDGLTLSGSF